MDKILNGESGLSIRTKLNEIIDNVGIIEITLSDLKIEINNDNLTPGALYKITGVHKGHQRTDGYYIAPLYDDGTNSGVSIFLKALSTNKLERSGYGEFYNPKYDYNDDNNGILNNYIKVSLSNINGNIVNFERIIGDNGSEGIIMGYDNNSNEAIIYVMKGDWGISSSFILDPASSITQFSANFTIDEQEHYLQNDKVIWGPYMWVKINGGDDLGEFNKNLFESIGALGSDDYIKNNIMLDINEWTKITYNDIDYDKVYDYIEYDIDNDFIYRRKDKFNNDVTFIYDKFGRMNEEYLYVFMYDDGQDQTFYSGITFFPFGYGDDEGDIDGRIGGIGFHNNTLINSNMDFLNIRNASIVNNNFKDISEMHNIFTYFDSNNIYDVYKIQFNDLKFSGWIQNLYNTTFSNCYGDNFGLLHLVECEIQNVYSEYIQLTSSTKSLIYGIKSFGSEISGMNNFEISNSEFHLATINFDNIDYNYNRFVSMSVKGNEWTYYTFPDLTYASIIWSGENAGPNEILLLYDLNNYDTIAKIVSYSINGTRIVNDITD